MLPALIRAPVLHFVLLGGLLFLADTVWQNRTAAGHADAAGIPLSISASDIDQMRRDFFVQNRFPPTPEQLSAAVETAIEEEVLYRGALDAGLDRDNEAVRQRLVQLARFVSDDPDQDPEALYRIALDLGLDRSDLVVRRQLSMMMRLAAANTPMTGETPPDDAELEAYLRDNPEKFVRPRRVRITHVYFSEDTHGAAARRRADKVLRSLRDGRLGPDQAVEAGDPFLLGHHLPWRTSTELEIHFGPSFAEATDDLKPGTWSGPVRSGYGWHLIRIDDVEPASLPPLAEIRDRVLATVIADRREWRVRETVEQMRSQYRIEVEWPSPDRVSATGVRSDG
ncbi:peptidylprolyl isomerase [Microbaculum marinum]|uniref:Parvulin-like PPIase n=1 Tax=Microbaculum marinum TaxID=1764581 RepID=A0AAW9RS14_9HYPH